MTRKINNHKYTIVLKKKRVFYFASIEDLKIFGYSDVSQEEAIKDLDRAIETYLWAKKLTAK